MSAFLVFVAAFISARFADRVEFTTHHYANCERDVRIVLAWHGGVKRVDVVAERVFWTLS